MDAASLTLTAGDYLLYSVLGICVVFFGLILLMGIIKVLVALTEEKPAKATDAAVAAPAAPAAPKAAKTAPGSAGEFKLYDTDPRDAAMVMAIVADELGKPLNELRFISIREVK